MSRMTQISLLVAILSCIAMPAAAQATWDKCVDISGRTVVSVPDPSLNDVAQAVVLGGRPVIKFNPNVLSFTDPLARLFWYLHECGHHKLGIHWRILVCLMREQRIAGRRKSLWNSRS